jgi:radical SAM superfamily enzyme YgiQ (UPF0313 family)
MPDSFEHMPPIGIRMPNGALTSLAGNVDPHHGVAVADLILVQDRVRRTVCQLVGDLKPDVVGLSVMTFQRGTAKKVIALVRSLRPRARIVVGGYDPSLAPEAYAASSACGADVIVRGEGEVTFRDLVRSIEAGGDFAGIAGLTYRDGDGPARESVARRRAARTEAGRARAARLHAPRPAGGRRRDLAWLHVRLQFLLDRCDARPELPHLRVRAGAR